MQEEDLQVGSTFHLQRLVMNLLFIAVCWLFSLKSDLYLKNNFKKKIKTVHDSLQAEAK